MVKPSAKPRRTRLLSKGRKLNNKKRGRPKKAAPATEKKNKKNQSALDLLHAKTLSAAPPQGQRAHASTTATISSRVFVNCFVLQKKKPLTNTHVLVVFADVYRPPQSPFYQLPPKVQHYPSSQLLLSPTPPGLQQLLGELIKIQCALTLTLL